LAYTFAQCPALKKIPASLLPRTMTIGTSFLDRTFMGSGIESIPDGFLPNYTTVGSGFLSDTFTSVTSTDDGCPITEIPAGFIPATLTTVGNSFLSNTFKRCNNLKSIPENFVSHITNIPGKFLYQTFAYCTGLTSIPANFVPQNPTKIEKGSGTGGQSGPFNGTFSNSGIKDIPNNFIPESYKNTSAPEFLVSTFSNCNALTSVNLDFLQNVKAADYYAFMSLFSGCANLTEAHLPYVDTGSLDLYASAFTNTGSNFKLYISGGTKPLFVYQSAGLTTATVSAVYLDSEDLVTAYRNAGYWSQISDDKFQVKPNP
jgi:hypothetical protein